MSKNLEDLKKEYELTDKKIEEYKILFNGPTTNDEYSELCVFIDGIELMKRDLDLSDYQVKKFGALFDTLDVTNDCFIDFTDFVLGAQYVKTKYKWADNDKLYLDLLASKADFWVMLQCMERTIPENKVNKTQMIHFFGEMANAVATGRTVNFGVRELKIEQNTPPGWVTAVIITIFKNLDLDESNKISKEEFRTYLEAIHIPINDAKLEEIWATLMTDFSGSEMDINLMEDLLVQWLLNKNEEQPDPGDYLPCGGYGVLW